MLTCLCLQGWLWTCCSPVSQSWGRSSLLLVETHRCDYIRSTHLSAVSFCSLWKFWHLVLAKNNNTLFKMLVILEQSCPRRGEKKIKNHIECSIYCFGSYPGRKDGANRASGLVSIQCWCVKGRPEISPGRHGLQWCVWTGRTGLWEGREHRAG